MNVGENIKKVRMNKGLSTYELSEMTGIPQSTISKLENNKRKIDTKILFRIAKSLDIPAEELFKDERLDVALETISNVDKIISESLNLKPSEDAIMLSKLSIRINQEGLTKEEMKSLNDYLDFLLSKRKE